VRNAWFAQSAPKGVRCTLCERECLLREGEHGPCGVRECAHGELRTTASERVARAAPRRIEALGLYHVLPGSRVVTAAFAEPAPHAPGAAEERESELHGYLLAELGDLARRASCRSVSFGGAEPALFVETLAPALESLRRARLLTILQTGGGMTPGVAGFLAPRLDAVSVHVSTLTESTARRHGHVGPHVLRENLQLFRRAGVWVEVSTLLEPGVNDSAAELLEIALSLRAIDAAIPWHVRCIPGDERRPARWAVTAVDRALDAGTRAGLEYVYASDAPCPDRELTFCPVCRDVLLIERFRGEPVNFLADGLRCPRCRTKAQGLFQPTTRTIGGHVAVGDAAASL